MLSCSSRYFSKSLYIKTSSISISRSQVKTLSYFVTTPIFYVNSSPHIGHVYTLLLADALNIHNRLKLNNSDTIFSTGTDEHGSKVQTSAELKGLEYKKFCDINSSQFKTVFDKYDTTLSDFIRTSDERHKRVVRKVWSELEEKDYIYKSTYSGWYCSSDETFVPESQIIHKELADGTFSHHDQNDNQVLWLNEENYLFKLSIFVDKVLEWLKDKRPIIPQKFNSEAIKILESSNMGDISVSRPKKRISWGIEVPNDPSQTIYVWLDALTNYLTAAGYPDSDLKRRPIDCQVIGKDIIKFHAIYWPAFLMALSLPLPKQLLCHSHWLMDSMKMSKSRGNVANPNEENEILSTDGLRYYLLRNGTPHSDTDYSRVSAIRRVNSELADTYGNLLSRCCGSSINPNRIIPTNRVNCMKNSQRLVENLEGLAEKVDKNYSCGNFYLALDDIMEVLRMNNGLFEETKPWKLVKEIESSRESLETYYDLLAVTFETLRICSILLQPIVPKIAQRALRKLSSEDMKSWNDARYSLKVGDPLENYREFDKSPAILFNKIR